MTRRTKSNLTLSLILLFSLAGCGKVSSSAPAETHAEAEWASSFVYVGGRKLECKKGIDAAPGWAKLDQPTMQAWLDQSRVTQVTAGITRDEIDQFMAEFARIPRAFRQAVAASLGDVHLIHGTGVTEDPSWPVASSNTFDGRIWATVPGAGGSPYLSAQHVEAPTRFVVNRLYQGHGSINLVLHEFGHAIDSLRSSHGFSNLPQWHSLLDDPATALHKAMGQACGTYCSDHSGEGFAETFAMYYACDDTRQWLQRNAPEAAQWMSELIQKL